MVSSFVQAWPGLFRRVRSGAEERAICVRSLLGTLGVLGSTENRLSIPVGAVFSLSPA